MVKYSNRKVIEVRDWGKLVEETYGRPYSFQQQDGCKAREMFSLTVPSNDSDDEEMNDSIPEEVNGEQMGVKFKVWLERDPKIFSFDSDWENVLFWERNFYPEIYIIANDLHKKGLIEAGEYSINIDW